MSGLPLPVLLLVFALAAVAVWRSGRPLSDATDALDKRFHLGDALGGLILLAIATNLPEIAITFTAALAGHLEVAVGNLLGGIALQTVVLVLLDFVGGKKGPPLTARVRDLTPALEATLVVAVLGLVVAGTQLPKDLVFLRVTPGGLLIAVAWLAGVRLVGRARKGLPWKLDDPPKAKGGDEKPPKSPLRTFAVGALVTLVAGYVLEQAGDGIAKHLGMTGALFGATVLAAATSLPEVATGLASLKNGDDALALGDIFGGNAFLPVLFLLASVVSGRAVLPTAKPVDVYLTALGIAVTVPYAFGVVLRSYKKVGRFGVDSLVVLAVYLVGVVGLAFFH